MTSENFEKFLKSILKNDDIKSMYQQLVNVQNDDENNQKVLYLLKQIFLFGGNMVLPGKDIVNREHWNKSQKKIIDFVKALIPDVQDQEVQALICDAVWGLTRDYVLAKQAYETYACLVETSSDTEKVLSDLNRMMYIACACNQRQWKTELEVMIKATIPRCTTILNYRPYQTLQYALEKKLITDSVAIGLIDQLADAIEKMEPTAFSPNLYDDYLDLKEKLLAKSKNIALPAKVYSDPGMISVRKRRVDVMMKAAERTTNWTRQVKMWKEVIELTKAISKSLSKDTMMTIKKKLAEAQEKMVAEQKEFSYSIDASEIKEHLLEECEEKTPDQIFSIFLSSISFQKEQNVEKYLSTRSLVQTLGLKIDLLDRKGKLKAILPALDRSDSKSVQSHAVRKCIEIYDFWSFCIWDTVFWKVRENEETKTVAKKMIDKIVEYSVIIPLNRKKAFRTGLSAGIDLDFCTALSILAPQMENIFFTLAENYGHVPYSINEEGIESRMTMEQLLSLEGVCECLDEDVLFNLKVLFTSPYGYNIRNEIAHGMYDDEFFQTLQAFWIWCMILKFCFLFYGPPSRLEENSKKI